MASNRAFVVMRTGALRIGVRTTSPRNHFHSYELHLAVFGSVIGYDLLHACARIRALAAFHSACVFPLPELRRIKDGDSKHTQ